MCTSGDPPCIVFVSCNWLHIKTYHINPDYLWTEISGIYYSSFQILLPLLALYVLEKEGCQCVLNAPEGLEEVFSIFPNVTRT